MMHRPFRLRTVAFRLLTLAAVPVLMFQLALCAPPVHAQDGSRARVTLPTLAPAALARAVDAGPIPSSQSLTLTLTLGPTPAREAALTQFLADVTSSSSPRFHQWLTPAQFAASYGATGEQLAAATAWMQAQGLTLQSVSPAGTRITVSGSAAQVQAAFAVSLDFYQQAGFSYIANTTQPSLPAEVSSLFVSIAGLDSLPADSKTSVAGPKAAPGTLVNGQPSAQDIASLAAAIDANNTPILSLDATLGIGSLSASQLAGYTMLFRQAAAQGITTIVARLAASGGFPDGLSDVTTMALPNDPSDDIADKAAPFAVRPAWQVAPGLPADGLRHTPDLTASSLREFSATMQQIAGTRRLGNINAALYAIAATPRLYTQPDAAAAGTWEPATGLGLVDLHTLAAAFPSGTATSVTTFQATNYSPIHGQGTSFTSTVSAGSGGGAQPTGSVSFVTSNGAILGTATLVNGAASVTLTTLAGGNLSVDAVYSGDSVYASSTSPSAQLYVQPEPSQLSVAIGGNPVIGGSYTVTVTDATTSGQPGGPISVALSGTSSIYTAALAAAGANSSSATVTIPATTPGTLTLSITCTTSANYSCYNPFTSTVTVAKATPTISISYSPTPAVSGANIALQAVVSTVGTAPAPTGAVTFYDNATVLNTGQLTNGSTSATGIVPTTPTHTITATYAGDPNYNSVSTTAGSGSSGTISTSLALLASSATVTTNQPITFTATLTPSSTGSASPTGTIVILDGGVQIGTVNLSGNSATFTSSTLSSSSNHIITAVYSGDTNYTASTSNGVGLTPGNNAGTSTTTTLVASPNNPIHGEKLTLSATVTPPAGGVAATGTVSFTSPQVGSLGQAAISNGIATLTTNQFPGGVSTVSASYSGSTTYNPSFSAPLSVTVSPEPVQLSLSVPASATYGSPFPVTVLVTGASGVSYPTGNVVVQPQGTGYSASSTGAVTSSGSGSTGSAQVIVPGAGAGSVSFTATYAGDKSFAAAGPVSTTATVAQYASAVTVSFSPSHPVAGQPTMLIAKVSFANSVAPTGPVHFYDGAAGLVNANVLLDATGTATATVTLGAGNHSITAVYKGDANYAGATSLVTNTTTGTVPTSTALTLTPATVSVGSLVTLSSTVGPTVNGVAPSGSVQFTSAGNVLCTGTLSSGSASCTMTPTLAGASSVAAYYGGDSTYNVSTSPVATLTVTPAAGGLTASISPASAAGGTSATVTAIVTAPAGTVPTGTVSATMTNSAGTVNLSTASAVLSVKGASNIATVTIPMVVPLTAGSYGVTVACVNTNFSCGNVNLALVSTGSVSTGTKIITTTMLTSSAATIPASGLVTLSATILATSASSTAPTGSVIFYDGVTPIATSLLTTGSVATASITLTGTVAHSLTAVYSGDTGYAGSTSTVLSLSSAAATNVPVVSLSASTTSGVAGSNVVLTAKVAAITTGGAAATGTVTFYLGGATPRLLGTSTLGTAGSGLAVTTLSVSTIPAGAVSVYAVYAGDSNFSTATSNSITFGLTDFGLTFVPQSITLTPGQSGQSTILLSMLNGFSGTVAFGCTPAPDSGVTCSFGPTTLAAIGNTTMTIATVAPQAMPSQHAGLRVVGGLSFAGLLCLLLPAKRRRMPAMLAVLLALALTANLGCSAGTFVSGPKSGGTPLGTSVVTITAVGSDGVNTVRHTYSFQVTVQ